MHNPVTYSLAKIKVLVLVLDTVVQVDKVYLLVLVVLWINPVITVTVATVIQVQDQADLQETHLLVNVEDHLNIVIAIPILALNQVALNQVQRNNIPVIPVDHDQVLEG